MTVLVAAIDQTGHDSTTLETVFNACFLTSENTCLVGGADEPLYLPADAANPVHRLFYREDFFASALHEIAHWCIAGASRRQLRDFGYWYEPEGRSEQAQAAFLSVEARPQALEYYLSAACGYRFQLSLDSFDPDSYEAMRELFAQRVVAEAQQLQSRGLPERAGRLFEALAAEFESGVCAVNLPPLDSGLLL